MKCWNYVLSEWLLFEILLCRWILIRYKILKKKWIILFYFFIVVFVMLFKYNLNIEYNFENFDFD